MGAGQRNSASGLMRLSHGAGCACKIGARELEVLRGALPPATDPDLLVGLDPADDAAVYRLTDEMAIVQTIDFFTPIVDDPYDFGRVAATNAISDIYAMGATPRFALNVVAFPLEELGPEVLGEILRGGSEVTAEAGIAIAGGHSIDDPEPKYGMAVTGTVNPRCMLTKAGGQPGDKLFLTKPLGGGLVTTAAKRGMAPPAVVREAISVMTTLNRDAAFSALVEGATAMTDVTGFGLLGHLGEVCASSGVAAQIEADAVPVIEGAMELALNPDCVSGGSRRNSAQAGKFTTFAERVGTERRIVLSDAMTSGGLLVAVPPAQGTSFPGVEIGSLTARRPGTIEVV